MTELISLEPNDLYIIREFLQLLLSSSVNIKISSESVLSADTITDVQQAPTESMVQQLLLQMQYLEKRYKKCILYIHLDDISVLNGRYVLFTSLQRAFPIHPDGKSILVYKPLRTNADGRDFFPPALTAALQRGRLPFRVPLAVNATSFGMFCTAILQPPPPPQSRLAYFIDRCLTKGVRLYV
jgi:hypothetical protein